MRRLVLALVCLLVPSGAYAQLSTASGIAGAVKDASGAVLPGVTVEAESPVLIEKVRTVVTDGEGRYNVIALPAGTYAVTFKLSGFTTSKHEGIVLTAGFTATVNVELKVGTLAETVTVTGDSPLVDTQNVRQQTVISKELLDTLPSGVQGGSVLISMTPGLTGTASLPDVGGSNGYRDGMGSNADNNYHGRQGLKYNIDGLSILSVLNAGTFSFVPNPLLLGETTIETGGAAESSGSGLAINALPREGGNQFHYMFDAVFSNGSMQSDNLTAEWISRGIAAPGKVDHLVDVGGTIGGPIKKDRAWFFLASKVQDSVTFQTNNFYNALQNTPPYVLYAKDLGQPAHTDNLQRSIAGHVTYQMSRRNKLSATFDVQKNCVCHQQNTLSAPEAQFVWHFYPSWIGQVTWNMPVNNKLLLEAASGASISWWNSYLQPEVGPHNVPVTDAGYTYGMGSPRNPDRDERYNQRISMSYVTGTHTFKIGLTVEELIADYGIGFVPTGWGASANINAPNPVDIAYTFLNRNPVSITEYSRPYLLKDRVKPDLGLFAQDQWAIQRLTLNYGVRFDYFSGYVPAQDTAATRFIGARHYDQVDGLPDGWKDFSPRVGFAYDLFGTGRTAIKFNIARYVTKEGTGIADQLNPINTSVNQVARTWADSNKNYIPDCDLTDPFQNGECGTINNLNFGRPNVTTHWADDVLKGMGARPSNWDVTLDLQQQLGSAVSLNGGYDRNWVTLFRVTDNVALAPADFDPFCITAPANPNLPGGGGYPVCGLFDVKPAKFTVIPDNLVTKASNYGSMSRVTDFFYANISTRFKSGLLIRGGIDTGTIRADSCDIRAQIPEYTLLGIGGFSPTNPFCSSSVPFIGNTQIKLQGSYPLPHDFFVSAIFQNVPSVAYGGTYNATNAEVYPSLGRNLAACGTRTLATCTATVPVQLFDPSVNFETRRTQLDLRISKGFKLGGARRLQANLDLYNAMNSAALLTANPNFTLVNNQWRNPTAILPGRLLQVSGRLMF